MGKYGTVPVEYAYKPVIVKTSILLSLLFLFKNN